MVKAWGGMSGYGTIIIGAGVATVVISGSVIGGVIAKVLNDGDNHKTKMTTAPPPPPHPPFAPPPPPESPPPPPGAPTRRLNEHEEIYGKGNKHFDLTKEERGVFSTLARRQLMDAKLRR